MTDDTNEEWLRDRQDGRVYPVGRALRGVFDADNHDTLGGDVTGLMIDLSRVPYGGVEANQPTGATGQPEVVAPRRSILARMGGFLARR